MKMVKITVIQTAFFEELAKQQANPILGVCEVHKVGQIFYTNGWQKPEGMCDNAWKSMMEYCMVFAHGGSCIYEGGWTADDNAAVVCCNDGFRPVSFRIEATNEDAPVFM